MLDDTFFRQLLATFVAETQEHVQATTRHLLALEEGKTDVPPAERWAEVFREVHSLKGAARATNQGQIEELAHRLETLFGRVRSGERTAGPRLYDLAYQALDGIAGLAQEAAGNGVASTDVAALLAPLDALDRGDHLDTSAPLRKHEGAPDADVGSMLTPAQPTRAPASSGAVAPGLPSSVQPAVDETVRVTTTKLDLLMAQVGELQVARLSSEGSLASLAGLLEQVETGGLEELRPQVLAARLRDLYAKSEADHRRLAQAAAALQGGIRSIRVFPVAVVLEPFPRMVRDLARALGKEVRLDVRGSDTEVDRSVLEHIKDPLTHLLRNAVDHGIEEPAVRRGAGKPTEGTIILSASQRGDLVVLEVEDDGAGIDLEAVRAAAVKNRVVTAEEAASMSEREAAWLIFRSGLSTSGQVTGLSGRGVGLDVVRDRVEHLRGLIDVESTPGCGTHFTLSLPLTVATTLCMLVEAAGELFALPVTAVVQAVRVLPDSIGYAEGRPALQFQGRPILLVSLARVLGLADDDQSQIMPRSAATDLAGPALILASAERRLAFRVDALIGAQELVVSNLPGPLQRVRFVAGASILGTGDAVLVLNATDLLRSSVEDTERLAAPVTAEDQAEAGPPSILVADDSITTRTLEKNILESAGYRVRTAPNGLAAWEALESEGCAPWGAFSLLVSDVAMPGLDGLALTSKVRADERTKHLPVVLVTSLDSPQERERGLQVGADAYLVKSAFDQENLLETIRRLI